ncbi:LptF/LptG family permease [Candidatus Omnitrophota bacterium]
MNIFHRYVIREHIAPFVLAFSVIMFILILKLMLDLMDMLITKNVDIITMAQLLFYNLAWMIALVVPMSVLVATVMAFGQMAASREIVAMKAAGISMFRIASPVIGISILITIFMIWFNNKVLPEANQRTRNLNATIFLKKPMLSLKNREGQFITEIKDLTIRVDSLDYETEEMYGIILFKRGKGDAKTTIGARSGHFLPNQVGNRLTVVLKNGEFHQNDDNNSVRYVRGTFDELYYNLDFNFGPTSSQTATKNDRTMTANEMRREIEKIHGMNDYFRARIQHLPVEQAGSQLRIKRFERDIKNNEKKIAKYTVEIHKKNSIPFAAVIFVLVGAPLGILVKRSGASIGISLSFGFFMVYYLFLIGGESAADRMIVAPWFAMWAPNIFLFPLGLFLFIYATRR